MLKAMLKYFYLLSAGLAIAIVFILVSSIIDLSNKLGSIHPYLQWSFIALVVLLFGRYIIVPFIKILLYPKFIPLPQKTGAEEYYTYLWYLRCNILKSPSLGMNDAVRKNLENADRTHYGELEKSVKDALDSCNSYTDQIIKETAVNVGIFTAISQSGRIDAIILLVNNIRMINKIISIYRQRPSVKEILKIYTLAGSAAFLADQIEDMEIDNMVADSLHAFGGVGLALPVIGKMFDIAVQGVFNAFLTMRMGFTVKKACGALTIAEYESSKQEARKDARGNMRDLISRITDVLWGKVKPGGGSNIFQKISNIFSTKANLETETTKKD